MPRNQNSISRYHIKGKIFNNNKNIDPQYSDKEYAKIKYMLRAYTETAV